MFFSKNFSISLSWKNPCLDIPRIYFCLLNLKLISLNLPSNLFGTPVPPCFSLSVLAFISEWFGRQVRLIENGSDNKVISLIQVRSPRQAVPRLVQGHSDATEDPHSFCSPILSKLVCFSGLSPHGSMTATVVPGILCVGISCVTFDCGGKLSPKRTPPPPSRLPPRPCWLSWDS